MCVRERERESGRQRQKIIIVIIISIINQNKTATFKKGISRKEVYLFVFFFTINKCFKRK